MVDKDSNQYRVGQSGKKEKIRRRKEKRETSLKSGDHHFRFQLRFRHYGTPALIQSLTSLVTHSLSSLDR
jgi:hypothetical protein